MQGALLCPDYDGLSPFRDWRNRFEIACRAADIVGDRRAVLLPTKLTGAAIEAWNTFDPEVQV